MEFKTLEELAFINPDSIRSDSHLGEIEYIDIQSVGSGYLIESKLIPISKAPSRARRLVKKGDTILSTVRPNRRSFLYIKETKDNLIVSTGFAVLRPKNGTDSKYLYYAITEPKFTEYLTLYAKGAAYPAVDTEIIKKAKIPFYPFETQRKIAAILSAYDDLIENNTRRIQILEEMTQRIYQEWFVNFRFPGHEKVKFIDSELGKIPEGWEVKKVGDVIQRLSSGKKYDNKSALPQGKVPILDQGRSGIIGYHNNVPDVIASEEKPIIVFANHTCYQRLIMFPFSAIQDVIPFIPSPNCSRNIYWLHWATKDLIKFNDYKGHFPEFTTKQLVVPYSKICEDFGNIVKPMVILKFHLEQENKLLRETRDLLLPKLISGELDVSNLDITVKNGI